MQRCRKNTNQWNCKGREQHVRRGTILNKLSTSNAAVISYFEGLTGMASDYVVYGHEVGMSYGSIKVVLFPTLMFFFPQPITLYLIPL
ncbi:hypothetical protein BJ508DRAFT_46271 [Ascobolus immersus RN42]|uniref:Uncharacterized protein n=1 Tax=Ascobolus immersus RN42 TaxID=1160509 RepID=A0A3N4IQW3_ASCIM|nr:hypothetical protein BJ508DRAFT_46271 [Ascobolus immersus RN42]